MYDQPTTQTEEQSDKDRSEGRWRVIFWVFAVFVLAPLFAVMYKYVLLFLVRLVAYPFGGIAPPTMEVVSYCILAVSLALSIMSVIKMWKMWKS